MSADPVAARLAAPALRYRSSYLEALREGFRCGIQPVADGQRVGRIKADFAGHLGAIADQGGTIRLPDGQLVPKVPFSLHWLGRGQSLRR